MNARLQSEIHAALDDLVAQVAHYIADDDAELPDLHRAREALKAAHDAAFLRTRTRGQQPLELE